MLANNCLRNCGSTPDLGGTLLSPKDSAFFRTDMVCSADIAALIVHRYWLEWLAVGLLFCFVACRRGAAGGLAVVSRRRAGVVR